jgi:predicted ATPase
MPARFLSSVSLKSKALPKRYPFNLPLIRGWKEWKLDSPVVLLSGENGSGKSTLLEALAAAIGSPAVGGQAVAQDETLEPARALGKHLRLSWSKPCHKGFFLRAEDFFNFSKILRQDSRELEDMAKEFAGKGEGLGWKMAAGAAQGQRQAFREKYGEDLDARSHGESFLKMFQSRLVKGGLYLLDEPEAPLSAQRQLTFLSLILQHQTDSQFIIATHSPILLACPGAAVFHLEEGKIKQMAFEDLENVRLTKRFLENPAAYLKYLV